MKIVQLIEMKLPLTQLPRPPDVELHLLAVSIHSLVFSLRTNCCLSLVVSRPYLHLPAKEAREKGDPCRVAHPCRAKPAARRHPVL
jgi:hypothetical protein